MLYQRYYQNMRIIGCRLRLIHDHIHVFLRSCSGKEGAVDGVSLIVLLRLWRVTRIVNGNT